MKKPSSFHKLQKRLEDGSLRSLSSQKFKYDFYSNDYLGLAHAAVSKTDGHKGSGGSRLISGNSTEAEDCESFLADFFEAEAGLVFNSGYDANLGLFSSVAERNDTILYDEYIHASIRDGIRLSQAKSYSFEHNNPEALEKKLKLAQGTVFIALESLYSMDGDFAPLKEILALSQKYGAYLIVDEAHSGGILGKEGRGFCHQQNLHKDIFARVVTFGKAYGTHGAVVLGSQDLKNYLVNFARSFIYTTALPPAQYTNIREAITFSKDDVLREKLGQNIRHFVALNSEKIRFSDPSSPIQILSLDSVTELKKVADNLQNKGFGVKIIQSPTVPLGKERIRVCIHAHNTQDEIERFSEVLSANFLD